LTDSPIDRAISQKSHPPLFKGIWSVSRVDDGGTVPGYFGAVQGRKKEIPNIRSSTPKEIIPEDPL
jgi:hypothetical protein